MTNKSQRSRLAPEWHSKEYVLIAWPHENTDWDYMLEEVSECYRQVALAISKYAKLLIVTPNPSAPREALFGKIDNDKLKIVNIQTNDTWARDFGMICTADTDSNVVINDFKFNGWGLKFASNHDNLITRGLISSQIVNGKTEYRNMLNFVLEGGSIDIDSDGTLLTTEECLLSPNRNGASTKEEIEATLKDVLGATQVLWLQHGALDGDDTDSHVDTLARFIPGGCIAYASCDRVEDKHFADLMAMKLELEQMKGIEGKPYKLIPLPIPSPIYDEEGQRLPATYANFLLINGAVLLPIYGDPHYDAIAIETMREAMPGWNIVPIDCSALIKQHGSLHCITMQLPHGVISV